MAFNLGEFAKLETDKIKAGVMMNLLRESPILELIPFEDVDSLQNVAVRASSLPSAAWRRVNEGYTPNEGTYEQVYESVYGFGGEIEFDRVFGLLGNTIVDPKVHQTMMKTKAMALTWSDALVNGDHAVEPDGIEGLKKRIASLNARQTVAANAGSLLDPTASAANARKTLDKWEQAHYHANQGDVNAILMNEGMLYGFARILRFLNVSGGPLVDITKDMFDREIMTYKGAPMIDAGLKVDQATEIIPTNENPSANTTSTYFVPFNTENGISGIQLEPVKIYDPLGGGERESKPTNLLRLDWWNGLAGFGSYGPSRLTEIEDPADWT